MAEAETFATVKFVALARTIEGVETTAGVGTTAETGAGTVVVTGFVWVFASLEEVDGVDGAFIRFIRLSS